MERITKLSVGVTILIFGFLIIFVPSITENFWLVFIWIPGIALEAKGWTDKSERKKLVPGGVLLTIATAITLNIFVPQFTNNYGLYILAPAVGLIQLYFAEGRKNHRLLVGTVFLIAIAAITSIDSSKINYTSMIIGVCFVGAGINIFLKNKK